MLWNDFTFGRSRGYTWRRLEEGAGSPRYVLVAPNGAITHYDVVLRHTPKSQWVVRAGKDVLGQHDSLDKAFRMAEADAKKESR